MAAMVYINSDSSQSGVVEIVADYVSDVDSLDTSYYPGSTCIVIENSSVYMLGTDHIWHEI